MCSQAINLYVDPLTLCDDFGVAMYVAAHEYHTEVQVLSAVLHCLAIHSRLKYSSLLCFPVPKPKAAQNREI